MCATDENDGDTNNNNKPSSKTIFLIRHAESDENRRIHSLKSSLGAVSRFGLPKSSDVYASFELINVPAQVDSNISEKGQKQIQHVKEKLSKDDFLKTQNVQVIVHSPLKRARDTCQGMLGCLAAGEATNDKAGTQQEEKASTTTTTTENKIRVEQLDLLSEKTPSEWLPGGTAKLHQRIKDFEVWIGTQPETTIAVVGHSQYFRAMLGTKSLFGNCEVWQVQYNNDPSSSSSSEKVETCAEGNTLKPGWSGLKRLYSCDYE